MRCYEEAMEGETPPPITEEMRALARLIADFYEDYCTGGALHVVLDDWNLDDSCIKWCLSDDNSVERDDERIFTIGERLLALSEEERYETLRIQRLFSQTGTMQ
jgi:hypothetical protein